MFVVLLNMGVDDDERPMVCDFFDFFFDFFFPCFPPCGLDF